MSGGGGDELEPDRRLDDGSQGAYAKWIKNWREHYSKYWRPVMDLRLVRGSFFSAAADDAAVVMDAGVWSKLPEEVMWEVVQRVPAAKLVQLQLVSRKWRQVLTSAQFRNGLPEAKEEQQRAGVVACVWPRADEPPISSGSSSSSSSRGGGGYKLLRVDLAMVPRWFWRRDWFGVVAAGHGLICIANDSVIPLKPEHVGKANRYCVLNPLTRTCVVLPPLPFEPHSWVLPSRSTVAIWGASRTARLLATYDLQLAAADGNCGVGAGDWVSARKPVPTTPTLLWDFRRHGGAMLGGNTYWYTSHDNRLQVTAAGGAEVGALAGPSVALLGLDEASLVVPGRFDRALVMVHRGAVYLVAGLETRPGAPVDAVCGVWRLAWRRGQGEERMEWEGVARLDRPELERVAGVDDPLGDPLGVVELRDAYGVRELVCCHFTELDIFRGHYRAVRLLGFNLDTSKWELVFREQKGLFVPWAFELRPDVFLSS